MGDAVLLSILAIAGVASMAFSSIKKVLDEVPDVIDSAGRARDAWRRFKRPETPQRDEQPPPADEEEQPPAAA
ncbi:hypothetical protein [Streptomyces malaysiensis]|uniref:hypothetical protein n=1 Tax=Streptomyces malaysiensis TaxID=92644 RepID=UPI002B2E51C3|nr:hypothetical protein R8789_36865 [Streptomyces malaysiensis]